MSRYQSNPGEIHWTVVKNILKFQQKIGDLFSVYGGKEGLIVKSYIDASFQTDKDDFRSQLVFVFCLNGGIVIWKSSKQEIVVDSTIDAKYIVVSSEAKEVFQIKKFITKLRILALWT